MHRESRSDLRLGGAWTPLQRAKNDFIWAVASVALAVARLLPARGLGVLGRALGAVAYAIAHEARGVAIANVDRVFPGLDERQRRAFVRQCFATVGGHLGETVAHLRGAGHGRAGHGMAPLPLANAARALLEAARTEGHGVVFPSAHLGPWERVAASMVAAGVPLVTLARESYDPRFSGLYARLRGAHGVRVVWRGSPGAASRIIRALRGGEVLGMPMDLRARVPSCAVSFLGHDAPTAVGPAHIALRTGAAVVVGTAAPDAANLGSLAVTATRIPTHDLPRGTRGVHELTVRINAELSRRILALPHAWVWMHPRWG